MDEHYLKWGCRLSSFIACPPIRRHASQSRSVAALLESSPRENRTQRHYHSQQIITSIVAKMANWNLSLTWSFLWGPKRLLWSGIQKTHVERSRNIDGPALTLKRAILTSAISLTWKRSLVYCCTRPKHQSWMAIQNYERKDFALPNKENDYIKVRAIATCD